MPLLFVFFACSHTAILGCPAGVIDLGPNDVHAPYPSPTDFISEYDGIEFHDMLVLPGATVDIDTAAATGTVIFDGNCADALPDRIAYSAPVTVHTDEGSYPGSIRYDYLALAPVVVVRSLPLPGVEAWITEQVEREQPGSGPLTEFVAAWHLEDEGLSISSYHDDGQTHWTQYSFWDVPEYQQTFRLVGGP